MTPYESHPVDVTITITGGVGLTVSVRNQGAEDVLHLDWESHLTGGFVLLPSQRASQGVILYLGSGDELMIQRVNPLVGVGIIELTVTIGKTTESLRGLLLFFVFIPLSA